MADVNCIQSLPPVVIALKSSSTHKNHRKKQWTMSAQAWLKRGGRLVFVEDPDLLLLYDDGRSLVTFCDFDFFREHSRHIYIYAQDARNYLVMNMPRLESKHYLEFYRRGLRDMIHDLSTGLVEHIFLKAMVRKGFNLEGELKGFVELLQPRRDQSQVFDVAQTERAALDELAQWSEDFYRPFPGAKQFDPRHWPMQEVDSLRELTTQGDFTLETYCEKAVYSLQTLAQSLGAEQCALISLRVDPQWGVLSEKNWVLLTGAMTEPLKKVKPYGVLLNQAFVSGLFPLLAKSFEGAAPVFFSQALPQSVGKLSRPECLSLNPGQEKNSAFVPIMKGGVPSCGLLLIFGDGINKNFQEQLAELPSLVDTLAEPFRRIDFLARFYRKIAD